jgi:hypothetical protein
MADNSTEQREERGGKEDKLSPAEHHALTRENASLEKKV